LICKVLMFLALYGFILAPMVAIIVFEHFYGEKANIIIDYAEKMNVKFNRAVFWAWVISFGLCYFISVTFEVFLSFMTLPAWVLCGVLFLLMSKKKAPNS